MKTEKQIINLLNSLKETKNFIKREGKKHNSKEINAMVKQSVRVSDYQIKLLEYVLSNRKRKVDDILLVSKKEYKKSLIL